MIDNCNWEGSIFKTFKSHVSLSHNVNTQYPSQLTGPLNSYSFTCYVPNCTEKFIHLEKYLKHLNTHFNDESSIQCPFKSCSKSYDMYPSYKSHISRNHSGQIIASLIRGYDGLTQNEVSVSGELATNECPIDAKNHSFTASCDYNTKTENSASNLNPNSPNLNETKSMSDEMETRISNDLLLFYLNLYGKHFIPQCLIQEIIDTFISIHELDIDNLKSQLSHRLSESTSLDCLQIKLILEDIFESDIMSKLHSVDHGIFRSKYSRKKYLLDNNMFYIEPISHFLGQNKLKKKCYFHVVPIEMSIKAILKDKHFFEAKNCKSSEPDTLNDYCDGEFLNSLQDPSIHSECQMIDILFYQDEFENVNPLGAAKKNQKILAFYFCLGQIHPKFRSNCNQMQLALLCKSVDVEFFGLETILRPMVNELKRLEKGFQFNGQKYKCRLVYFAGDHLGHHTLAGLQRNFSNGYICQYCNIHMSDLSKGKYHCKHFNKKTKEIYANIVSSNIPDLGIQKNSILNELDTFHVMNQMLPCVGHDWLEGVISYDFQQCIKYFVDKKIFTVDQFNLGIAQFKFSSCENQNRPSFVNATKNKLTGSACQIWNLARFFHFFISPQEENHTKIWEFIYSAQSITNILMAHQISRQQVAILDVLIDEYLEQRLDLFPNETLKPKHHYMTHYPQLILLFGPPIKFWTLRYESKHRYFKRCSRSFCNYKNITKTLALCHQDYQTGFQLNTYFDTSVSSSSFLPLNLNLYSDCVRKSLPSENFFECEQIELFGHCYRTGLFLPVKVIDSSCIIFGKICSIFVDEQKTEVYFLLSQYLSFCKYSPNTYFLHSAGDTNCFSLKSIPDFHPLSVYNFEGECCIVLKNAIIDYF